MTYTVRACVCVCVCVCVSACVRVPICKGERECVCVKEREREAKKRILNFSSATPAGHVTRLDQSASGPRPQQPITIEKITTRGKKPRNFYEIAANLGRRDQQQQQQQQ